MRNIESGNFVEKAPNKSLSPDSILSTLSDLKIDTLKFERFDFFDQKIKKLKGSFSNYLKLNFTYPFRGLPLSTRLSYTPLFNSALSLETANQIPAGIRVLFKFSSFLELNSDNEFGIQLPKRNEFEFKKVKSNGIMNNLGLTFYFSKVIGINWGLHLTTTTDFSNVSSEFSSNISFVFRPKPDFMSNGRINIGFNINSLKNIFRKFPNFNTYQGLFIKYNF